MSCYVASNRELMVDEEVVARKLETIERYLRDLRDEQQIDESTYLENERTQRVVERLFNNLINACIDLAAHVREAETLPKTGSAAGDMKTLGEAGILPEVLAERMIKVTGFRNASLTTTKRSASLRYTDSYRILIISNNSPKPLLNTTKMNYNRIRGKSRDLALKLP